MKIVIVEDHLLMREAIRYACTEEFGHQVVGEADRGANAIQLIGPVRPDVVILDLNLPDMDGFAVAGAISKTLPTTRFLVITASLDDYTVYRIGKLGIHGFLDKGSNALAHLRLALDALATGKTYYSPAFQSARLALRANANSFEKVLSVCEQEILSLVGEGLSDQEISTRLGISPSTSQTHRSNILQKLNVKGTPKLIAYAINNGFTRINSRAPFSLQQLEPSRPNTGG